MSNKDFKKEHFKERTLMKFQQNVDEMFRKVSASLSSTIQSIDNRVVTIEGADPAAPKNSAIYNGNFGSGTFNFAKNGYKVVIIANVINFSTTSNGYARLKRDGTIIDQHNFDYAVTGNTQTGVTFVFYDSLAQTGTVTYAIETTNELHSNDRIQVFEV